MPRLIVLSGLPGTGKSTIARGVAAAIGAAWIRIDSIEQALRAAGLAVGEAGYAVGYPLAADQLRVGCDVVADSVNPLAITRDAWCDVAAAAGAALLEVELVCSDAAEHRRRVEGRRADVAGLDLPDWAAVLARNYEPWQCRRPLRIDTAQLSAEQASARIVAAARTAAS